METKKVYDKNAAKWLRMEPSSLSDFTARPLVFDACGETLNNRSVLDLGCGEGYCARELKRRGAGEYIGIDLSAQMIKAAQTQEEKDQYGIQYHADNVIEYKANRQFDLCIAVFLFNYLTVNEMGRVFANVYRALKEGGEFIFTIPHPFFPFSQNKQERPFYFEAQGKNYFNGVDHRLEGQIWKRNGEPLHVQCIHKTLENYFSKLKQAGFSSMPEVTELTVTQELVEFDEAFFMPLLNQPLHMLFKITRDTL